MPHRCAHRFAMTAFSFHRELKEVQRVIFQERTYAVLLVTVSEKLDTQMRALLQTLLSTDEGKALAEKLAGLGGKK